jgi:hypothetical protein
MKTVYLLRRISSDDRTLGTLLVFDGLTMQARFSTLEPPWRENKPNVSCIPAGVYTIKPRSSPKFDEHLIVDDVPGRSYILAHRGNTPADTEGCVLVGMGHQDIDKDGKTDVFSSRAAMGLLVQFVRVPARFVVVDA